jgi:hypothetical protein
LEVAITTTTCDKEGPLYLIAKKKAKQRFVIETFAPAPSANGNSAGGEWRNDTEATAKTKRSST